ncbi:hypothetical protein AV530_015141 [Patagioenas fasciata monilis]|uniref:Uncharacterized protein n=1 Tax=Patagioenas fasciata monilis TaxID=372326 RepID=A0A1V4K158_PATFA|nr:hypothetical protein AV530_015141 [Patagioenas fasciata monilis]
MYSKRDGEIQKWFFQQDFQPRLSTPRTRPPCVFFIASVFGHAQAKLCHVWPPRNREPNTMGWAEGLG